MIRVVFNRKGGVGKSTIVCNLAALAAERGRSTLVVDLDAQGNASQYLLGDEAAEASPGVVELFEQSLSFSLLAKDPLGFVHETGYENLDLMPSSPALAEMQSKLEARHKIYKLREALNKLGEHYEEIFIDTPPALNFFTISALIASQRCLIPFDCDDFSRRALYALLENVAEIRADHNSELEVEGIIVNQFQARSKLPTRLVDELRAEGLPVLDAYLSSSVKIRESHEAACPVVYLEPRHKLSLEYRNLADTLFGS